jgi:acyl-CoA thioester hydrolase
MGIVHHSNYLIWCEVGRTDYLRSIGTSYAELEKAGVVLAVAEVELRYHASARYDDRIVVTTTLCEVRSRTVTFDYLITLAASAVRLATARTVLVSLDGAGQVTALPSLLRRQLVEAMR